MTKRVVFIHYRTGERDGVGLEIEKRARLLRDLGVEVFYLSGFEGLSRKETSVIKEMDMKATFNRFLREDCFYKPLVNEDMSVALYYQVEAKIYNKIQRVIKKISPDLVFVHNMFSHAYNLPATTALIKILDRYLFPTVVVNHDFWFEREQFQKPQKHFIREILESIPPHRPFILKQQVINSFAYEELKARRGIKAEVIGDYFDFEKPPSKEDRYNRDLKKYFEIEKNDLILLHATRVAPRKAIENALRFAAVLEKQLRQQAPIQIAEKTFTTNSRVVILLPNFVEVDSLEYFNELKLLAEKLDLKVLWAQDKFALERYQEKGVKRYSLWDSYVFADLVTYTSTWEGYGNQFLEAIYFRKLPVVFEYPVFLKDIKNEGYSYISLGSKTQKHNGFHFVAETTLKTAAEETIRVLENRSRLKRMTNNNFAIAASRHNVTILKQDLEKILSQLPSLADS